eukprot:15442680-Alexandrium_andersonii.AAC.1
MGTEMGQSDFALPADHMLPKWWSWGVDGLSSEQPGDDVEGEQAASSASNLLASVSALAPDLECDDVEETPAGGVAQAFAVDVGGTVDPGAPAAVAFAAPH